MLSAGRPVHCAGSELVVLVFEQDVERGERFVTARDVLLQIDLVRFAQFAWNAIASAKAYYSRSPPTQGNATQGCGDPIRDSRIASFANKLVCVY